MCIIISYKKQCVNAPRIYNRIYIYISYGDDDDDNDNYYSDGGNTRIKTRRWREDINPGSGGGRERLYFNARALLMYYLSRAHIIIGHAEEMKSLMRIFFPTSFFCILFYLTLLFHSLSLSLFLSDTLSLLFLSLSLSLSPTRFLYYDILVVVVEIYSRRRLRRNPPPTLYTVAQLRQKKITPVQLQTYRYRGRERTRSVSGGGAVG